MKKSIPSLATLAARIKSDLDTLNKRKAEFTAKIVAIDGEILEYHNALREVLPHDCSQGGTRKIYQYANIRDAIMAHLPTSKEQAIPTRVLYERMKASGLTYAITSVYLAFCNFRNELESNGLRGTNICGYHYKSLA